MPRLSVPCLLLPPCQLRALRYLHLCPFLGLHLHWPANQSPVRHLRRQLLLLAGRGWVIVLLIAPLNFFPSPVQPPRSKPYLLPALPETPLQPPPLRPSASLATPQPRPATVSAASSQLIPALDLPPWHLRSPPFLSGGELPSSCQHV